MSERITVTYKVEPKEGVDLAEIGRAIAREQSTGGQDWNYYRGEGRFSTHSNWDEAETYQAELRNPDRHTNTVEIAYPIANVSDDITHLLNYVAGDAFGSRYVERMKVLDVEFPPSYMDRFPGPAYGIDGIKRRSRIGEDRPLLGVILKPSLGLTPSRIDALSRCAIEAGVDLIKEDEKLGDPDYCRFEDRLDTVVETLRWMRRETDRETLYVLNVTGRGDEFREYVRKHDVADVLDRLVLLVTVVSHGFGEFRQLAEDPAFDCPMYAHRTGHAAYTRTDHGVSMRIFEKLSRLAGADFAHCGAYRGIHGYSTVQVIQNEKALTETHGAWADVRPTLPVLSGGITPENLGENLRGVSDGDVATDVSVHLGESVYATGDSYDDVAAAIRANRQAIDAALENRTVDDVLASRDDRFSEMREWIRHENTRRNGE